MKNTFYVNCKEDAYKYAKFLEKIQLKQPKIKKLTKHIQKIKKKIQKYAPILLIKHIIRLSNILWYQFHRATYCYSIYYYTKNQMTRKEIETNGQKPAKDVTYMHHSLKNTF